MNEDVKIEFEKIVEKSRAARALTDKQRYPEWAIQYMKRKRERKQQLLVKMLEREATKLLEDAKKKQQ